MKLKDIRPNPSNPRVIKDHKFEKLKQSIRDFPEMMALRPMVINEDNIVLGGNMRLRALQDLGYKNVPDEWVKKAHELTEDQQREFIVKDNAGFGEWDWDLLANEWDSEELGEWGLDVPIDMFGEGDPVAEEDGYEEDAEQVQTNIQLGDLIEIGRHRLLCGDSTDADVVGNLMDGGIAGICFTDPPFDLENISFTDNLFANTDGHIFILNAEQRNVDISCKHKSKLSRWYAVDFRQAHLISNNAPMSRVDYIAEFRNCDKVKFYNKKEVFSTLIESGKIHSKRGATVHKQEKRIELPALFLKNFSQEDEICLDIFLGSGSTMVACEQLNRTCYGIELDPKYCQVVINRMRTAFEGIEVKINGDEYNG